MTFLIEKNRGRNFPLFKRPEVLGYFSLNGSRREYVQDLSQLKYFNSNCINKPVKYDLNAGIHNAIKKPNDLDDKIDNLLRWIIDNHLTITAQPDQKRWLKPNFVCYRGLLTKICCTPYEDRDGWIICAVNFHGTIYLCDFDTEKEKTRLANISKRDRAFKSWGYKFEQYLLSDSPTNIPNIRKPVNEAEEFCCIFDSKLGNHALFFGAEMDGVCSKNVVVEPVNFQSLKFVELKTSKIVQHKWESDNFKKKILKWWCQSFLVGIEDIICGTKTQNGMVLNLENMKVSSIPKMAKNFWNAADCMNFCHDFLEHMKNVVSENHNECIYKFEYKPGYRNIEMQKLDSHSEYTFLPKWYIEQSNEIIEKSKNG